MTKRPHRPRVPLRSAPPRKGWRYAAGMPNDERPEPNWRRLVIVLGLAALVVGLALIVRWLFVTLGRS
ncbi:hypothetical protein SAMN05444161_4670 [Rhizobiales bacterium GAS191]|nr:hypothetical protein SAMN05444161_4670 [Rhizobiales bacterium GAS191]